MHFLKNDGVVTSLMFNLHMPAYTNMLTQLKNEQHQFMTEIKPVNYPDELDVYFVNKEKTSIYQEQLCIIKMQENMATKKLILLGKNQHYS